MTRPAAVAALLVAVAACAVPTRIDMRGPDFDGARTTRLRGNVLPTPVGGIGAMELNAERVTRPEQPSEYALLVEMRVDGLRIRQGNSLRLTLDGDTVLVARDSLATSWTRLDPTVQEQARYPAPDSLLQRLARSRDVSVAVRGAGWWESRRLTPRNLDALRGFTALHVTPDSVAPADTVSGRR